MMRRGPTYETSRAALGGAPWREVPKSTDAWYILDEEVPAPLARAESLGMRLIVVALSLAAVIAIVYFVTRPFDRAEAPPPAAIAEPIATPTPATPGLALAAPELPAPVVVPSESAPVTRIAHERTAHHAPVRPAHKRRARH